MGKLRRKRDTLDFLLGFLAGAFIVGIPLIFFFGWDWPVIVGVTLGAGILGGLYGDPFFNALADSPWWKLLVGYWRRR